MFVVNYQGNHYGIEKNAATLQKRRELYVQNLKNLHTHYRSQNMKFKGKKYNNFRYLSDKACKFHHQREEIQKWIYIYIYTRSNLGISYSLKSVKTDKIFTIEKRRTKSMYGNCR